MAFWEFLIQKEGDRSWLPLESPDVEVLEGRYRVVARSSRVTASVEICVSHIDAEAQPAKQRIQKRLSQTNRDGLVVVIPFTRLDPGAWELRCTGDLMSDMVGDGWRYAVTLQVLPHHSDQLGDWDVDDPDSSGASLSQPASFDDQSHADADQVEENEHPLSVSAAAQFSDVEATEAEAQALEAAEMQAPEAHGVGLERSSESVAVPTEADTTVPSAAPDSFPAVELALAQNLYVADWGQALSLAGQIEPLEVEASGALLTMPTACLHITLRDPQTADVLSTMQQPLESGSLPYPFAIDVLVPDTQTTRLLLGEVMLMPAIATVPENVLATAAFTVTTDLNHLLEAIANDFSSEDYAPLESVEQSVESRLDFSLLNLVNSSSAAQAADLAASMADLDKQSALVADGVQLPSASGWVEISVPPASTTPEPATPSDTGAIADEPLEWDAAALTTGDRESLLAFPATNVPQDQSLQSLDLQNRFLSRLSALASDTELSGLLEVDALPFGLDTTLASQEFVLQDDIPLPPVRTSVTAQPTKKAPDPEPAFLSADEPVPTPVLTLPTGELISGKQIHVTVALPDLLPRFYVKLWVRDRQTQTTLDGPRWVMHFNSDGRGSQQAQTIMTIPFGCLDAQFEAIAIEMATQRESHKVTIPRNVLPPDLPTLSIDELEL